MAEQTRDQSQSRPTTQPIGSSGMKSAAPEQLKSASEEGGAGTVMSRRRQYLIGSRPMLGAGPVPTELIVQKLNEMQDVEIIRRLRPRPTEATSSGGMQSAAEIISVRMDERRGEELRRTAAPNLVIEPDGLLHYAEATLAGALPFHADGQTLPLPYRGRDITFRVVRENDRPLAGASIFIFGSGFPAQTVTDASGQGTATFYDEHSDGGSGFSIAKAVYVKPAADYWDGVILNPALGDGANLVKLRPLGGTFPNFPGQRLVGWGHRMMQLDLATDGLDGAGVKIGLIDSGCDHTHPLLRHVTQGVELIDAARPSGWTIDPIGHGTHCAGIIAAGERSRAQGILGFAPGAELHVFKVIPGGRCSDLIAALDQCIERQIDVVSIGVGCEHVSELVALKLAEARQKGVACIVAAGGSGGQATFPASAPGVLAVAAVGKLGEFPADSCHAQMAVGQPVAADGLFIPRFSGFMPQGAVYAPGVAVISTAPGGGYAACDGTSIAAAHIAGCAAVLLAHHPLFQGIYRTRSEQRVTALFDMIRASGNPSRLTPAPLDFQWTPAWPHPMGQMSGVNIAAQAAGTINEAASVPAYLASPNCGPWG
jgi:subtilisin